MNNSGMWFTAREVCVMESNSPNSKEILSTNGNIASPPPPFFFPHRGKKGGGQFEIACSQTHYLRHRVSIDSDKKYIYTESNGMYRQAIYIDCYGA